MLRTECFARSLRCAHSFAPSWGKRFLCRSNAYRFHTDVNHCASKFPHRILGSDLLLDLRRRVQQRQELFDRLHDCGMDSRLRGLLGRPLGSAFQVALQQLLSRHSAFEVRQQLRRHGRRRRNASQGRSAKRYYEIRMFIAKERKGQPKK